MFRFGFLDASSADEAVEHGSKTDEVGLAVEVTNACSTAGVNFAPIQVAGLELVRVAGEGHLTECPETDLIPGIYEGGLKIWECSTDLAEYLVENIDRLTLANAHVVELGCGHGIPGLVALKCGAHITFSDFNAEVLERVTWNNIHANCAESVGNARCIAGDWLSLSEMLSDRKFGLILSAETCYTEENCAKIVQFVDKHIAEDHGMALIATKRYYFGVGGGSAALVQAIQRTEHLQMEKVKTIDDGKSNIREIFCIRRP